MDPIAFFKSVKKYGLVPTLIIIGLWLYFSNGNVEQSQQQDQSQDLSLIINNSGSISLGFPVGVTPVVPACVARPFEEARDDWLIRQYNKPDGEGFYCAEEGTQPFPPIWYKEAIPIAPGKWEFDYRVRGNPATSEIAPFFLVFGDAKQQKELLLRVFVHEKDPRQIGFDWFVPTSSSLDWVPDRPEKPYFLDEPVDENRDVIVTVEASIVAQDSNIVSLDFTMEYISRLTGEKITARFSRTALIPHPRPAEYLVRIGFGVPVGYCLKPEKVMVCP